MKRLLLALLLSGCPAFAGGGGWVSSGGELFKDGKNPWFVRNVKQVSWCLQVDEPTVSAAPERVRALIGDAIGYWKREFALASQDLGVGSFQVATQDFVETPCIAGVTDLSFKVGYATLTQEEREYLKDPTRFVGVSVRTDYDPVQLKGRGFIFVSSDRGANAYRNSGNLITEAWKEETLLYYVVLHELGHVFGLPHTGSGLMSEVFFDQILNQGLYEIFARNPVETYFQAGSVIPASEGGVDKAWFGATAYEELRLLQASGQFQVEGRKTGAGASWEPVGVIKNIQSSLFDVRNRPAVMLQLTPEQQVFSGEEARFRSFMIGANYIDGGAEAVFTPQGSSIPKGVYLRSTSGGFQVMGVVNGRPKAVFNYTSLIAAKLLLNP